MNLNINYSPNAMGEMLLQRLKDDFGAAVKNFTIQGDEYLKIVVTEKGGKLTRGLNHSRAIQNCMNQEELAGILAVNKIPFGNSNGETLIKQYELFVFDLKTISIKVQSEVKSKPQTKYIKESENSRSVEIARQVVYLLGLDFAVVHLALTARRRFKVMAVDPSPVVREKDFNTFYKMLTALYQTGNELLSSEVKLGADPEFMMINTKSGRLVSASEFFPRDGMVGCDNIRIPNRQQRPVAEIRPAPETDPLELIDNVKRALNSANRMASYRNVKWVAGSQPVGGYSIGGHIHFSNLKLNYALLRALDNFLGITVFMLEVPVTAAKRRKKYGFLADYRMKNHGGFEYRTPGSWLVSQKIATAVICLAKIVVSRYLFLDRNYLNSTEAQAAFYAGNQDYFKPIFDDLWEHVEKTDLYNKYIEELEIIPYMIENAMNWDEKNDLRKKWRLVNPKNQASRPEVRTNVQPKVIARNVRAGGAVRQPSRSSGDKISQGKKHKINTAKRINLSTSELGNVQRGQINIDRIVISSGIRGL